MSQASVVAAGKVVTIHYTLTLDDGRVVDSSMGRDPLEYLHGARNLVPGLERELTGRNVGDAFDVAVEAMDGYGMPDPAAVQTVPRGAFPPDAQLEVGMTFQARDENDRTMMGTIRALVADQVTVDFNHPLAGERLNFAIVITAVRESTAQERTHGHVHAHGHDH